MVQWLEDCYLEKAERVDDSDSVLNPPPGRPVLASLVSYHVVCAEFAF
jgi:hypothetical protein